MHIELTGGVGFLGICPRHHRCCYAPNDRRPHQHLFRSHFEHSMFVVRRGLVAGGKPTTQDNSKPFPEVRMRFAVPSNEQKCEQEREASIERTHFEK
jgi:hypothetical protein